MSPALPKHHQTAAEYLAAERGSEEKHEFFGGEAFAIAGASDEHNVIASNVLFALIGALRGRCQVFTSDMRVLVPVTGLYAYPDASVVCGSPSFADDQMDILINPAMLVEVLSPTTENYDRGRKFENYRAIPTLTDYLLVAQDRVLAEHYSRRPDGWLLQPYTAGARMHLLCDANVAVDAFYVGLPAPRAEESSTNAA